MAATPRPWRYKNRNWRNELDPHNFYITGDHCEGEYGTVSTSVAIVCGNETAGTIPEDNARLIVRAVNLHDELVAALKLVVTWQKRSNIMTRCGGAVGEIIAICDAALAKAEAP